MNLNDFDPELLEEGFGSLDTGLCALGIGVPVGVYIDEDDTDC